MTEAVRPTTTPAATTPAAPPELPPRVQQAMAAAGLDPAQVRGAWRQFGLSVGTLPVLLAAQGLSADDVGKRLASHGVTAADLPAIADFIGVPADQRQALAALLKLPDPPAPAAAGETPAASTPAAPAAPADTVAVTPATTQSGSASPVAALFDNPAIREAVTSQVIDRDPEAIAQDRRGLTPEIGLAIGQQPSGTNTLGLRLGTGLELGRHTLSGNAASGTVLTLDAVAGLNLMAGAGTGLVQSDVSLRAGIGHNWAVHSRLLDLSLETSIGVYAIAGGIAQAGVVDGNGSAAVGARVGGGVQLGPLFVESTRAYTTAGIVDQTNAGIRIGF